MFFYFDDGYYYPTTAGTILLVALLLVAVVLAVIVASKNSDHKTFSAKKLVFSGMAIAIAYVLSFIQVIKLPYGGAVTPFSMLFICLIGYWYGVKAGLLTGFAYSILQFLQDPYILTPFQVCCDYFFAFTALGLSGLFSGKKHGLQIGYLVGVLARLFFHVLGGYIYWMEYMPDNFPIALKWAYPVIYNGSYIGLEAVITLILLAIPAVDKAMKRVKTMALN